MKESELVIFEELFSTIIEKKRQQLEEYDKLALSMRYELFGDFEPTPLLQQKFSLILESIEKQKELIRKSIMEMEEMMM